MINIGRVKQCSPTLLAYPGFGYPAEDGNWRVFVSGIVWHEPVVFTMRQRMLIKMLGGVMNATPDELKGDTFQDRITPFMAESDQRHSIIAEIGGRSYRLKRRTKKNGHFRSFLSVDAKQIESAQTEDSFGNRVVNYSVTADHPRSKPVPGAIHLLERTGTSVVSDIDDTIKDSGVGNRKELLANTFLRDFRSIEGMADVYQHWSEQGAKFHYVSSSPWQLFESLHAMNLSHQFPTGTMHLRNFRLRDHLLKKVIIRRHGKTTAIRFLMKHLPERKFVMIGDSGEKDPEIYGKIGRKYPGRIKALLIRDIEHRPMEPDRSRKLHEAIPHGLVGQFRNAEELRHLTSDLF